MLTETVMPAPKIKVEVVRRRLFESTHDIYRSTVATFIAREVVPHFEKWETAGLVDRSLFDRAGQLGLLGMAIPQSFGGGGTTDFRFNAVVAEEFCAAGVLSAGLGIINDIDVCIPYFVDLATDEQRRRWMPGLCSGELIAAMAMTEPAAGSDLAGIRTRAVREGDCFVLNGAKHFISSAINCDIVIVVCRTGQSDNAHRNLTLLVVESTMPGFQRGKNLSKIGQHAADTGELFFTDVRVPVKNVLGEVGNGFYHIVSRLGQERLSIAVTAVAHAETAFAWTLAYCKERHAFGQPIGSLQHNRFALASMRTELDIARTYVDSQIRAHVAGELNAEEAAQAKWWCTDLNKRVLDTCLQLHGGYGYMEEYPIARAWRDGRAMSIFGGTNEIMKEIIGRRALGI
jgi:acyl-CoA dehydrogenase